MKVKLVEKFVNYCHILLSECNFNPISRNIHRVIHTFHRAFHRTIFRNILKLFTKNNIYRKTLANQGRKIRRKNSSENITTNFMHIHFLRKSLQEQFHAPANLTVSHQGLISLRKHSVPYLRYCRQGIHNKPVRQSWQHCHRKASEAANILPHSTLQLHQ